MAKDGKAEELLKMTLAFADDEDVELAYEDYGYFGSRTSDHSNNSSGDDLLLSGMHLPSSFTAASSLLHVGLLGCLMLQRETDPNKQDLDEYLDDMYDDDFFNYFRVTKETFRYILDIFSKHYQPVSSDGKKPIVNHLALSIGLSYLGNECSYEELAESYEISESCAHGCVKAVIDSLDIEASKYVKWPRSDDCGKVEAEFRQLSGFPGVLGALGNCHIECKVPEKEKAAYLNSEAKHSIHLMAVCNPNKAFTFLCAGYIGSAEASTVLKYTDLYEHLVADTSPLFPSTGYHLVAGSSFPIEKHLLVPYGNKGGLTNEQKVFNNKLSTTTSIIDSAFAFLKARFRVLKYLDEHISRTCQIVKACCVLHNITLMFPEETKVLLEEGSVKLPQPDPQKDVASDPTTGAVGKRNNIATNL